MTEQTDSLADLIAEHAWRPDWWRCGRTCDWLPDADSHVDTQHAAHVAAVVRAAQADAHPGRLCNAVCVVDGCADLASRPSAAQADETTMPDGRYAGMTATDALRLVSVNRIRELTIERDAARAEVERLREEARKAHDGLTWLAASMAWATDGRLSTAVRHAQRYTEWVEQQRDAARAEVAFWQTAMQAHADCDAREAALDAARAEVAALRAAQPGREQVARAVADSLARFMIGAKPPPVGTPVVRAVTNAVLALFRQDQP